MDGFGTMLEKLDRKILILFILRRLPDWVDGETLAGLALGDGSVGYFEYAESLSELVDSENVSQSAAGYKITEKGDKNCEIVESSLPYTVRSKMEKKLKPLADSMRRKAMIKAEHHRGTDGCLVCLALSDGISNILDMKLQCGNDKQAFIIEENFRQNAEAYYNRIMEMLLGNE